jgi:hypothetical protein
MSKGLKITIAILLVAGGLQMYGASLWEWAKPHVPAVLMRERPTVSDHAADRLIEEPRQKPVGGVQHVPNRAARTHRVGARVQGYVDDGARRHTDGIE